MESGWQRREKKRQGESQKLVVVVVVQCSQYARRLIYQVSRHVPGVILLVCKSQAIGMASTPPGFEPWIILHA